MLVLRRAREGARRSAKLSTCVWAAEHEGRRSGLVPARPPANGPKARRLPGFPDEHRSAREAPATRDGALPQGTLARTVARKGRATDLRSHRPERATEVGLRRRELFEREHFLAAHFVRVPQRREHLR